MAKGHIEKRHKSTYTLIIDEGFDEATGIRKRWSKSVKTDDEEEAQRQLDIILGQIADKHSSSPRMLQSRSIFQSGWKPQRQDD